MKECEDESPESGVNDNAIGNTPDEFPDVYEFTNNVAYVYYGRPKALQ